MPNPNFLKLGTLHLSAMSLARLGGKSLKRATAMHASEYTPTPLASPRPAHPAPKPGLRSVQTLY